MVDLASKVYYVSQRHSLAAYTNESQHNLVSYVGSALAY